MTTAATRALESGGKGSSHYRTTTWTTLAFILTNFTVRHHTLLTGPSLLVPGTSVVMADMTRPSRDDPARLFPAMTSLTGTMTIARGMTRSTLIMRIDVSRGQTPDTMRALAGITGPHTTNGAPMPSNDRLHFHTNLHLIMDGEQDSWTATTTTTGLLSAEKHHIATTIHGADHEAHLTQGIMRIVVRDAPQAQNRRHPSLAGSCPRSCVW